MGKKEGIRRLFNNIASDYDRLNHILSLNIDKGWRRKAVREIADQNSPVKVLDVACGTGDFTIEIARKVAAGSEVIGDRGAYEYLRTSVLRFPAPDKFMAMLKSAGFEQVEHRSLTFGICRMYICEKSHP